ncbi:MAG: DinB family protein [Dehalococcoidia bacterium]
MDVDEFRNWLRDEAAARTIDEMIAAIDREVAALEAAIARIHDDAFVATAPGEEWSPARCLVHVVETNVEVATNVLHVALAGELPAAMQPAPLPADRDGLLRANREALDSLYEHLRAADPAAFLDLTWNHFIAGDLNWREWTVFVEAHVWDHAGQLSAMADSRA